MNSITKYGGFVGTSCRAFQVDHECPRLLGWEILSPVDDEFFGAWVEIALAER